MKLSPFAFWAFCMLAGSVFVASWVLSLMVNFWFILLMTLCPVIIKIGMRMDGFK